MKIVKISALLVGAMLFVGMGATTLSAEGMKCGAGKCGSSMKVEKKEKKCGDSKCGSKKLEKKCGDSKCGSKKSEKKSQKCGAGKCGSDK